MKTDAGFPLAAWVESRRQQIERVFETRLPALPSGHDPGRLVESMRYSLLAPGKRLRPLLALAAAEAVTRDNPSTRPLSLDEPLDEALLTAAAAVELIHCYSLIHDDLPAMDDDDFRRGKPSNHKVFGEAVAILAGDALLTLAFEWLAAAGAQSGRAGEFGRAALSLARSAGMNGMVRGQARDLAAPPPNTLAELERLHEEKTAALFRAAAEVGAAAVGADAAQIAAVGKFGHCFGVAFQHADDREDGDHDRHAGDAAGRVLTLLGDAERALDTLADSSGAVVLRALSQQLLARATRGYPPAPATET